MCRSLIKRPNELLCKKHGCAAASKSDGEERADFVKVAAIIEEVQAV